MILESSFHLEQPSIIAASSISQGKSRKKLHDIHTQKGKFIAVYAIIRANCESLSPKFLIIRKNGKTNTVGGSIFPNKNANGRVLPPTLYLAIPYPAKAPMAKLLNVTIIATTKLLMKY